MKQRRHPEIDRVISAPRGRRGTKPLRAVIAALIISGLFAGFILLLSDRPTEAPSEPVPARTSYTPRPPIYINGNADFTAANGVVSGDGTASNPYVIEGWDVSSSSGTAIRILNTDAHFVLRDCFVHGNGAWWGIYQSVSVNGTFSNNTFSANSDGILVYQSNNNTYSGNDFGQNGMGIYLMRDCTNNTISNNTFSDCSSGINLQLSCRNTIRDNNCSGNTNLGIYLWSSSDNNTIINNTCVSNGAYGMSIQGAKNNIVVDNDFSDNDALGLILTLSSSGNRIFNNTCLSNYAYAIAIQESNGNDLRYNNCSYGMYGLYVLQSSTYNNISWNKFFDNVNQGIYIQDGSYNRIWNNTFTGNNGGGVQANDDGTNNWWNTSGSPHGFGNYWNEWTGPDADMNGIVDEAYTLSGSAGANDYYPLTTTPVVPIPEFGAMPLVLIILTAIALVTRARRRKVL